MRRARGQVQRAGTVTPRFERQRDPLGPLQRADQGRNRRGATALPPLPRSPRRTSRAKILDALLRPFATGAGDLAVTASIGIALVTGTDGPLPTQDQVLAWADGALYAAKRNGRNRCMVRMGDTAEAAPDAVSAPRGMERDVS